MFASPAYASAGAASTGSAAFFMQIFPLLLIFVIFYFLLIRPQQRRVKQHQQMVSDVKPRDTAVTSGGLIGKVTKVEDGKPEIEVEVAPNVRVRVIRSTISQVVSKTEPVAAA